MQSVCRDLLEDILGEAPAAIAPITAATADTAIPLAPMGMVKLEVTQQRQRQRQAGWESRGKDKNPAVQQQLAQFEDMERRRGSRSKC
mmetsp:Transcript_19979/g.43544  ORF Transcript_19979/g.43544 Transcript_19979/m.43544 type:complete len:88 (-) Transcript_19979:290-553(-)